MPIESEVIVRLLEEWHAGINREEHFRFLFERYYYPINHFFTKRGFSADMCADLTQETFFCIYKGIETFRQEARFETWMFQIATNVYRQVVRRQREQKHRGESVSLDGMMEQNQQTLSESEWAGLWSPPAPLDHVLEQEQRQMLSEAIEALPDQMRRCVILWVYQELSYQQIAHAMALSVETVKSHLSQARQQLKNRLGHQAGRSTPK